MLTYFLVTLLVFSLGVFALALGVIFSNKPLKGSCGGLNQVVGQSAKPCACGAPVSCQDISALEKKQKA